MNRAFGVVLWAAAALTLAFLLVPIAAIFLRVPPGDLLDALGSPVARDALRVTLATTLTAQIVILVVGTPAAYLLATRRFRGRALVITLVELPLVLPPAVAGIAPACGVRAVRPPRRDPVVLRARGRVHAARRRARDRLRRRPVLPPHGDRRVRGRGRDPRRRLADARRRPGADVRAGRAAARLGRPRCRRRARVRPRARRVRRDDHVRGLAPGRHPDALARGLRAVRRRLRHRSRDRGGARRGQRGPPARGQADPRHGDPPRRAIPPPSLVRPRADARGRGGDARARRAVRSGQVERAPGGRGPPAPAEAAASPSTARPGSTRRVAIDVTPGASLGRARLPGLRALPPPERPAERRLRRPGPRRGRRAARAVPDRAASPTRGRGRSRAASGSGLRSHGRSRATPTCCSSTSRSPRSTLTRGRRCAASCTISSPSSASRSSSSRTTSRTPRRSPTGSASSSTGACSRSGRRSELVARAARPLRRPVHRGEPPPRSGARPTPAASPRSSSTSGGRCGPPTPSRAGLRSPSTRGRWRSRVTSPTTRRSTTCGRPIARITPLGNRARVAVGPLVAEITTASVERLALRVGEPVVASFKATAARLLPLA